MKPLLLPAFFLMALPTLAADTPTIELGSRRELLVDDFLIDKFTGKAELRMQQPARREIVLVHDAPWEGSGCGYHTVFRDGDKFRMYYVAADLTSPAGGSRSIP